MQPNQPFGHYAPPQQGPNPYAAPAPNPWAAGPLYRQNVFVPQGAAAGPVPGPGLRRVKLALGVTQLVAMMGGFGLFFAGVALADPQHASDSPPALMLAGTLVMGLWYLLLIGYGIANAIWIYRFWSWVPPEQRYTSLWKKYISPSAAVGFLFIPYFNIFWMFVVYLGLADVMERLRVQYPSSKGPAKTLAIVTIAVPMLFFPAAPFLQYFFAKHIEEMAKEMSARMPGARLA